MIYSNTLDKIDSRWWAPKHPRVGPGPVEKAMLEPGPDPSKDLGAALLAAHRTGAAACLATARTPLADEVTLVRNLAAARAQLVPDLVPVVSKAVGDEQYADLLARDFFDDAELAALQLYRSCVAKGVTPSAAFERVGLVYGVPQAGMTAFAKVATQPVVPPATLIDAADRALFTHVADVVANEQTTVSKATKDYHGREPGERDARGRFADTGIPGFDLQQWLNAGPREQERTAPEVGTPAQDETSAPGRVARKPRQARRARRAIRRTPQQATSSTEQATSSAQATRRSATRAAATRKAAARRSEQARRSQLAATSQAQLDEKYASPAGDPRPVPDVLESFDDGLGMVQDLNTDFAFVIPLSEFYAFARESGVDKNGQRVFRQGRLQEYAGRPLVRWDDDSIDDDGLGDLQETAELARAARSVADKVRPKNYVEPVVDDVDRHEAALWQSLAAADDVDSAKQLAARQAAYKDNWLAEHFRKRRITNRDPATERGYVEFLPDKADPSRMRLVYVQPAVGANPLEGERPLVRLAEIVVDENNSVGWYEPAHARHAEPEFLLDVNQPLVFEMRDDRGFPQFWDDDAKVVRTEIHARLVDEESVEQAFERRTRSRSTRRRYFGQGGKPLNLGGDVEKATRDYHGREVGERDARGRFAVPGYDSITDYLQAQLDRAAQEERVPEPTREARTARKPRQARRARRAVRRTAQATTQQATSTRQPATRAQAQRSRKATRAAAVRTREAAKQAKLTVGDKRRVKGQVPWADNFQYTVLEPGQVEKLIGITPQRQAGEWRIELDGAARARMHEWGGRALHADGAALELGEHTDALQYEVGDMDDETVATDWTIQMDSLDDDVDGLINRIYDVMNADESKVWFQIQAARQSDEPEGVWHVDVVSNMHDLPRDSVVRWGEAANPDSAQELAYRGRRRSISRATIRARIIEALNAIEDLAVDGIPSEDVWDNGWDDEELDEWRGKAPGDKHYYADRWIGAPVVDFYEVLDDD